MCTVLPSSSSPLGHTSLSYTVLLPLSHTLSSLSLSPSSLSQPLLSLIVTLLLHSVSYVRYLEELHGVAQANADHTTLLLNCYTKLKDTKKLQTFVHQTDQTLHYDVETAIKVYYLSLLLPPHVHYTTLHLHCTALHLHNTYTTLHSVMRLITQRLPKQLTGNA